MRRYMIVVVPCILRQMKKLCSLFLKIKVNVVQEFIIDLFRLYESMIRK